MPTLEIPVVTPSVKALHSWSLFRTMGRYVGPGSMPCGDLPEGGGGGLELLELPAELSRHGYRSVQLCHFYLPRRDQGYLDDVRAAFDEAGVALECFLIDDGDLAHPERADEQRAWLSDWIGTAEQLGVGRVRVPAGKQPPTTETLARSASQLSRLAEAHPDVRLIVENWHALLPDAASVHEILDRTDGEVGFLVDLGNWKGEGKYAQLAEVAERAETCQAKVSTDADGTIDEDDYRRCLEILQSARYSGPLAMVYDGADPDEWTKLDEAYQLVRQVFTDAPD